MISVLMSVFNESEDYVRKSIHSVLNQTYENIELIVVLDNPKRQDLKTVILEFAAADHRVNPLFNEKNMGLVNSLNKALEYAKGEYIARMDADDISLPCRLENEVKGLEEGNYDLVGAPFFFMDEEGQIDYKKGPPLIESAAINEYLHYSNCVAHPTWLAKKDLYSTLKGYRNIPCAEDYDFLLRAASLGRRIGIVEEHGLLYRHNTRGISQSNKFKQLVVTHYLAKYYRKKHEVTEADIHRIVNRVCTQRNENSFKKGEEYLLKAREFRENGRLFSILYLVVKCFVVSRFHIALLIRENRLKRIQAQV